MPIVRKTTTVKRSYKRRAAPTKMRRVMKNMRTTKVATWNTLCGKVMNGFEGSSPVYISTVTIPANTTYLANWNFTLAMLPNAAELQALFDMYRINGARVDISMRQNVNTEGVSGTVPFELPNIYLAADYNNINTAPASINAIREYGTCKVKYFGQGAKRKISYFLKPRLPSGIEAGGLVGQTAVLTFDQLKRPWVNTAGTGINAAYAGLMVGCFNESTAASIDVVMDIEVRLYYQVKNTK